MAALGPAPLDADGEQPEFEVEGSDIDAEGEDDIEVDYGTSHTPAVQHAEENSFVSDTQGDEDDGNAVDDEDRDAEDDEDEDEEDFVGAVKIPDGQMGDSDEDAIVEDGSDVNEDSVDEEDDDNSDKSSSSAESVAVAEWEGGSEGAEEIEAEVANRNNCM